MGVRNHEFELGDFIVVLIPVWIAVSWSFVALMSMVALDLDQGAFDRERVATPALALRMAMFWPIWSSVQLEDVLASAGIVVGGWWPLMPVMTTVLPAFLIGLVWVRRGIAARS